MTTNNNPFKSPSRREFLKSTTAAASAVGLGGLGSFIASPAFAQDYATGMTGGPTGLGLSA